MDGLLKSFSSARAKMRSPDGAWCFERRAKRTGTHKLGRAKRESDDSHGNHMGLTKSNKNRYRAIELRPNKKRTWMVTSAVSHREPPWLVRLFDCTNSSLRLMLCVCVPKRWKSSNSSKHPFGRCWAAGRGRTRMVLGRMESFDFVSGIGDWQCSFHSELFAPNSIGFLDAC